MVYYTIRSLNSDNINTIYWSRTNRCATVYANCDGIYINWVYVSYSV